MTGPLVLLGAALLVWPDGRAVRRARWAEVAGRRAPRRSARPLPPLPLAWGGGVAAVGVVESTWLVAVLAGTAAALLARAELRRRAAAREEARLAALAGALAALAAELRAGRTLEAATAAAARACADEESGQALVRAVRSPAGSDAGVSGELGDALGRVAAAAALSLRTGCSLAAVLAAVEDDLRARRRQRSDLRSATAGSRASALLLAALPVLALVMGSGIGADPWRVLTTTPTGQVLLVAGAALEAAGLAWSSRLVRRAVR
ncbi:type II secretion system F family protein [Geodermatophilus sp. SYSU D01105]